MTPLGKKQQQKVVAVVAQWLQLRTDYFTNQMRLCMRSFPIFFSWEIFSFSPTVNCNAVGQYKMLTKGDLLVLFVPFLLHPIHYYRTRITYAANACIISSGLQSSPSVVVAIVLHMLLLSAIASCPEESLEEILCITNVYCGFPQRSGSFHWRIGKLTVT